MHQTHATTAFFDYNGPNNYSDTYNAALDSFEQATVLAGTQSIFKLLNSSYTCLGTGQRLRNNQVDMDLRSAYSLMGASPQTPQEDACEYYQVDFVRAASPISADNPSSPL